MSELREQIMAYYEQSGSYGYPEDTWDESCVVSSAEDVFEFMKWCHKLDARNRNDYPIVSHWDRWVKFKKHKYQICNLGHLHTVSNEEIEAPEYYDKAMEMYKIFEDRLKRTLTHLRCAKKRKEIKRLKSLLCT